MTSVEEGHHSSLIYPFYSVYYLSFEISRLSVENLIMSLKNCPIVCQRVKSVSECRQW